MRFLIIGLGSMGKRRIRCLKRLGYGNILGYDLRDDRRKETEEKYGIRTVGVLDETLFAESDALVISTPPDRHNQYIGLAVEKAKPAFIEASIILDGLEELNVLAKRKGVSIFPSCTMRFHPAVKDVTDIVKSRRYGKITNFTYHVGQYLPDWHPWENVNDFFVSKKETGGCRELIPLELTWITDILGFPRKIAALYGKTMDVGADIDDAYAIAMDFGSSYGTMTVDVVSRYAVRSLILNMERGQIVWKWDNNAVQLYEAVSQRWINYHYPQGQTMEGYNKNVSDDWYVEETRSFVNAVLGKGKFPNSLDDDIRILALLQKIEAR